MTAQDHKAVLGISLTVHASVALAFLLGLVAGVPAATVSIGQRGMVFARSSASLAKGDQLVFTNEDDVVHNIHIFGPGNDESTNLGLQKPGTPLAYRFDKTGSYRVRCNIHPSMKMVVSVK